SSLRTISRSISVVLTASAAPKAARAKAITRTMRSGSTRATISASSADGKVRTRARARRGRDRMPAVADQRIVEGYTLGVFQSNTYVLAARAGESAAVIDPGQDAGELVSERLAAHGLRLAAGLLTHGHSDHIWDAARVADRAGIAAYIHPGDRYMLDDRAPAPGHSGLRRLDLGIPAAV